MIKAPAHHQTHRATVSPIASPAEHAVTDARKLGGPPVLCVRSLRKVIDDRLVLRELAFVVEQGAFVALLGANGAGKSTLLKILAGLVPATLGTIELFGRPQKTDAVAVRSRIGFIGHSPMLYRDLSARENLVFFGRLYGMSKGGARERASELLVNLDLADRADDPLKTFSRGMMQRAAIARALLCDPEFLLADEPFSGLDVPSCRTLESVLMRLHEQGKTILLANHDVSQSLSLAQRVIVLHRGSLVLDRPTSSVNREMCDEVIRQ